MNFDNIALRFSRKDDFILIAMFFTNRIKLFRQDGWERFKNYAHFCLFTRIYEFLTKEKWTFIFFLENQTFESGKDESFFLSRMNYFKQLVPQLLVTFCSFQSLMCASKWRKTLFSTIFELHRKMCFHHLNKQEYA